MSLIQDAMQKAMRTAIGLAPAAWLPGGRPDPLIGKRGKIGAPVSRIDGPLKVAGKARFAAEVPMDGLLFASFVYSRIARGEIVRIHEDAARTAPGVALVMTYRNAPRMQAPGVLAVDPEGAAASCLPIMQDATIHWNGQTVAVILAETQEQADHAASLIHVDYRVDAACVSFEAAKRHAHQPESVLGEPAEIRHGNAEQALRDAAISVDQIYRTPRYNHNAIELHAATIRWQGEELIVHDASQLVTQTKLTLAKVFGLAAEQVRVLSPYVGGGFGGKGLWDHQILGAAAARLAGRPVRVMLSREGVYRLIGGRTQTEQRVALAANADGTLAALIHSGVAGMTTHNMCPEQFTFPARHLYAADAIHIVQEIAEMDMLANSWMRAPGESVGTFALESALDELAEKLDLDPVELRRRIEPDKDPTTGHEFSARHLLEAYEHGAAAFGWARRNRVPRSTQEGEWLIGMGCATGTYPYYRMPGGSVRITLHDDGRVAVAAAAHEMGMGTATVQSQVVAERFGVPMEAVTFDYGDTNLPPSPVAGGSNQTASIGAAVASAFEELAQELLKLAGNKSPISGLSASEVEGRDEGLGKRDGDGPVDRYVDILKRAGRTELSITADAPPPLEMLKWSMHSYSACFCEVRVSRVTGEARVSRILGSFDCGRILNAKTATSQFRGGIIMGLGLALTEATMVDPRSGRIMNPSLAEYHVPVQLDVPQIDVIWTDIPDPHTPMGGRGIGEIGITGVGAAIANAIYNATGKRIRDLPITLDKLL